jgi:hypothetical protein
MSEAPTRSPAAWIRANHDVALPHLAVIVPCSKRKAACTEPAATGSDVAALIPPARLPEHACAARDLYRGRQFRAMVRAVDQLTIERPDIEITLHIVSAGHGLLASADPVVPYEATLGSGRRDWVERGRQLDLPDRLKDLLKSVDAAVIALSEAYLAACDLPHRWPTKARVLYLSPRATGREAVTSVVWSGRREARALGSSERDIRGRLLSAVLGRIATGGIPVLGALPSDPLAWPEFGP